MNGIIVNAKHVHGKHAKVNPIPHHYEGPGEKPYIKWHCPVCEALGNTRVSIPENIPDCSLCGVHLNWEVKPQVGSLILTLPDHIAGHIIEIDPKAAMSYLAKLDDGTTRWMNTDGFTLFVTEEELL